MGQLGRGTAALGALLVLVAAAGPGVSSGDGTPATGLQGEYFDNEGLSGPSVTRVDPAIDFAWEGTPSAAGIDAHTFSVRWTGTVTPRYGERYTFSTRSDDGVRVWVDGRKVIDDWALHSVKTDSGTIDLEAGKAYDIKVEFFEHLGRAEIRLRWKSASQALEVVPAERLKPPAAPLPDPPAPAPVPPPPAPADTVAATPAEAPAAPGVATPGPEAPTALPEAELPPPAPPVAGETFNAAPVRGEVLVRGRDGRLGRLGAPASMPIGARLDTRRGAVRIDTAKARGVKHPKQYARLSGGMFAVGQPADGDRVVTLDLAHGDFESCRAPAQSRGAARAAASRQPVRQLWGHGKGRFRTRGRGAVATVRGTFWNVEDTCDATIVRVREGVVDVEDRRTGELRTLTAGDTYTAWLGVAARARRGR